jgi:hypothetical protein
MRLYLGIAFAWIIAAYCFYNGSYGIRFPEKYMSNPWTRPRGVTTIDDAVGAAAFFILLGCFFFGGGLLILHAILTEPGGPLPPLP